MATRRSALNVPMSKSKLDKAPDDDFAVAGCSSKLFTQELDDIFVEPPSRKAKRPRKSPTTAAVIDAATRRQLNAILPTSAPSYADEPIRPNCKLAT